MDLTIGRFGPSIVARLVKAGSYPFVDDRRETPRQTSVLRGYHLPSVSKLPIHRRPAVRRTRWDRRGDPCSRPQRAKDWSYRFFPLCPARGGMSPRVSPPICCSAAAGVRFLGVPCATPSGRPAVGDLLAGFGLWAHRFAAQSIGAVSVVMIRIMPQRTAEVFDRCPPIRGPAPGSDRCLPAVCQASMPPRLCRR